LFDWEDFLKLAEQMSGASNEAAQRTAISRAYYAVYHAASSYIRRMQLITPGRPLSHREVWRVLKLSTNLDHRDTGFRGEDLKRLRQEADYRSPYSGDIATDARETVAEARALIADISRLP